ncbi:nuclear transport factor 2 family protein [Sphingopyxis sp. KK2]|uniref:nuclear transport factor 2 family protein n=1 Tax=Sphingopyxis sp. KK2 TaxID=1855727 RepID=UPI00097E5FD3|nr:nuclear transport factor 2 family protein [Sphingopyxis sp. KK2]
MTDAVTARLDALERELTILRDKEAIRDVIHRYCRGADRCDKQAFKDCYWEDGFDDHGFYGGSGQGLGDYVIPVLAQIDSSIHAITNTVIDLDGDRAFVESQWSVIHRLKKPDGDFLDFWHNGRYLDIFEKRNGEWRIHTRTIVNDMDRLLRTKDMRGLMGLPEEPGSDNNRTLRGARAPNDPVFAGFDLPKLVHERTSVPDLWAGYFALDQVL